MSKDWLLTPERVAIHRATGTAVAADLHLGYAEARRRAGEAVPTVPLESSLALLASAVRRTQAKVLVLAGDVFEAGSNAELEEQLLAWAADLVVELTVIPGNHDRGLSKDRSLLPVTPGPFRVGNWWVIHGEGERPDGPVVQGHLHPCVRVPGTSIRAACYLTTRSHLVLPAYSADAAGVEIRKLEAWDDYHCQISVGKRMIDLGTVRKLREIKHKERTP